MVKWKMRSYDRCPRCDEEHEDNIHVVRCKSKEAEEVWDTSIFAFIELMAARKVSLEVQQAILDGMNCWRSGEPETKLEYHRSNTYTALKEQNEIGWNNFMMGRIGKKWSKTLSNMYKGKKCKQFACADLVFQIYSIVFNMWDNRNKILHNQKEKHYLLGEEEADRKIQVQYSLGKYNLIPNDYHLLNTCS